MQQEGVASVLLSHLASHLPAFMLPCVEAPMSESTVLAAVVGAVPTGSAGAHVLGGVEGVREELWVKRIAAL